MVSDGLIEARQAGARCVRLEKGEAGIMTRIADMRAPKRGAVETEGQARTLAASGGGGET